MKGDFSRSTFRRIKHYRKVKLQQGRVQVDADWNEQVDIQAYYDQMSLQDLIGSSGGPAEMAGFSIGPAAKSSSYQIGAGRYYVNGLMVENENDVTIEEPQLKPGKYLAYLKVWEQGITALEDPEIRETALGGPDTSVRTKITWRVLLHKLNSLSEVDDEWNKLITNPSNYSDGTLRARTRPPKEMADACMLPPTAGYRRLDNQFYRIEIHNPGKDGNGATFKWSRDNASIAAKVTKISGSQLGVSSIGKDRYEFALKEDQWIEITDDNHELENRPGTIAKITKVDEGTKTITFDPTTIIGEPINEENYPAKFNPKITRWDSDGVIAIPKASDDEDPNSGYVAIEGGLEVKFGSGNYRTGDYWWVPARTAKGDIEWPKNKEGKPEALPPEGIVHHYCRLAVLEFGPDLSLETVTDLRRLFPAITTLTTMQYVGGDGQRGAPNAFLPSPLMVGVSRGGTPLGGVAIKFVVTAGVGEVFAEKKSGRKGDPANRRGEVTVYTDNDGIAVCYWQLDNINDRQQVEAVMLDSLGDIVHLPVVFNAVMERNAPPTGLRVSSGLIKDKIATETYKVIGPFYHGIDSVAESTAPPAILLGETNVDVDDPNISETVRQMEDLTLMSLLNRQYGIPVRDSEDSSALASRLGLDEYLDRDDDTPPVPVFFKPVSVDGEKFYVFLANYNPSPSQITWSGWLAIAGAAVKQMALGMNADGRLELFAIDATDQPIRSSQTAENGNWGQWVKMPDKKLKHIAVATNSNGTLHVFGVDTNDQLVHIWQDKNGNWGTAWSVFDPVIKVKKIIVANNADGRLEVFGIDMTDTPGHMWQTAGPDDMLTWSKWFQMHGIKSKDLTVGMNKDGRLEVFAIGHRFMQVDASLVAIQYSEDLFRLSSLVRNSGKSIVLNPAIINSAKTEVAKNAGVNIALTREIKAALYENAFKNVEATQPKPSSPTTPSAGVPVDMVFHAWQVHPNGDWSSWSQLGNQQGTKVAVANNADGRLEVFVIGPDERLYHIWQTAPNNGWSGWASLGGKMKDIAVANNADGRIEVFAVTPRTNLILSTGLLLDTKLIADKLDKDSLSTLAETPKLKAATVSSALLKANVIKNVSDVSVAIKAEDVAKFRELAILKNKGKDVTAGYSLYHIWQTAPNNGWSAWSSLGGKVKNVVVAANANGRLTAFALGEDDSVVNITTQMRIEIDINLRWWAIPSVDVYTLDKKRRNPSDSERPFDDIAGEDEAEKERKMKEEAAKQKAEREAAEKRAAAEKAAAERAAAAEKAAAERAAAEKASAAEKAEAERKAAEAREAAKRAAAEEAAAAKAAAEKAAAETQVARPAATVATITSLPGLRISTTINPNATRCAQISKEMTELQTQLKSPSLPTATRQAISSKIQALKAEKTKLNCPS